MGPQVVYVPAEAGASPRVTPYSGLQACEGASQIEVVASGEHEGPQASHLYRAPLFEGQHQGVGSPAHVADSRPKASPGQS